MFFDLKTIITYFLHLIVLICKNFTYYQTCGVIYLQNFYWRLLKTPVWGLINNLPPFFNKKNYMKCTLLDILHRKYIFDNYTAFLLERQTIVTSFVHLMVLNSKMFIYYQSYGVIYLPNFYWLLVKTLVCRAFKSFASLFNEIFCV